MKCHCGFKEVDSEWKEIEVLYVRGPKKGQVRQTKHEYIYGQQMEQLAIGDWVLKACPDCGAIYKDGYY